MVTDSGIEGICNGCQSLERINISHVDRLTDLSLRKLSICTQLKDVEAAGCSNFTDAGFTALATVSSTLHIHVQYIHVTGTLHVHAYHMSLCSIKMSYM